MRRPSGLMRMHKTSSAILSVRTWRADSLRGTPGAPCCPGAPGPPASISHSQNLMLWSALQLTKPLPSGSGTTDHTCVHVQQMQRRSMDTSRHGSR